MPTAEVSKKKVSDFIVHAFLDYRKYVEKNLFCIISSYFKCITNELYFHLHCCT